ncbi:DUF4097 family beta strand repeat-containing protein [Cytophagaceae bacterium DM2B3-1]|uniref:DUF4097 family beta strand repeat-containing protein n=1 Tax=Xanthocytophaga flava TaxID=3048013 RepID=A0ABT7CTT3_9BACT|nr:DUF4097 family beta strand repeat-containing protein [Xanthocytophaga flavus]MDJ1497110.1 DUF4097 family beta strand repeat-containing protein [Xanthocytophaga flavus]
MKTSQIQRTMNLSGLFRKYILPVFLLLLTISLPLSAQNEVKEQLVIPLSDPNKPGFLEVGLVNGSIRVTSHTSKEVIIEGAVGSSKKHKEDDAVSANGMRRIAKTNSMELTAEEHSNRISVNTNSHMRAIDLTIKVPQRFSLKLSTVNNGDILVENVNGELEITNVNGRIELTNIEGSAVANTVNGALIAIFKDITPNTPMAFSTLNGKVDVTLPVNVKANVKLKSDQGEIYSDFDIAVDKTQPKVDKSSQNGMYRVSVDDWTYGKINGGGPEIMAKNMHGNIYIRKAK